MCEYARSIREDAVYSAAYLLWRIAWIHPFFDGNGRVARSLSYLGLLVGLRVPELEGAVTIPELLDGKYRDRYFSALQAADTTWAKQLTVDVSGLESLISELMIEQIESA
jgi:hypothetical protein